jgi:hypothetical protein
MGCDVFANGDEIACQAGSGKVIAAFPDVCLTPPPPPTGPVPVPYADSSFSKDMKNGSRRVLIKRKPIMLKDSSFYKTSPLGDEAATRNLGAGVVTHVITGKTYFVSWSMDVRIEGENVDRHTDMTTSNHASPIGNVQTPTINVGEAAEPKNKGTLCSCCGGEAHSQEQQYNRPISEAEFYGTNDGSLSATNAKFLRNLKKDPQCKHLLPEERGKCGKYYATSPQEKRSIEEAWNVVRRPYKEKHGLPRGQPADGSGDVAHRVPKAAGGCPVGEGNLAPTKAECRDKETKLSNIQDQRANVIRQRYGKT